MRTPRVLKFNKDAKLSGPLYYSPHTAVYCNETYPMALHLFEAHQFIYHSPDLVERQAVRER